MTTNHYSFESKILFRNKYIQTILGSIVSGNTNLPERKLHKVLIDHKAQLMLFELSSSNPEATVILLAHGMGGCSESSYMRRIARKLWIRGFTVFMMNQAKLVMIKRFGTRTQSPSFFYLLESNVISNLAILLCCVNLKTMRLSHRY